MLAVSTNIDVCKALLFVCVAVFTAGCGRDHDETPKAFDPALAALEWNAGSKQWREDELKTLETGKGLYQVRCAGCHQRSGTGSTTIGAPALKGSGLVTGAADSLIKTVLFGRATMPAFRGSLDDAELARILSYVGNAWGNDRQELIQASRVAALRAAGKP